MSWKETPKFTPSGVTPFKLSHQIYIEGSSDNWIKVSKSSYTVECLKFSLPPRRPFTIPHQGPKVVYSEGDELTYAIDPVFDVGFTGIPLGPDHFPCGYWHKNYSPPEIVVYTSTLYPLEDIESANILDAYIVGGEFKETYHVYSIPVESVNVLDAYIVGGEFKVVTLSYDLWPLESVNILDAYVTGGEFRQILYAYTYWPAESADILDAYITGGVFKDSLIEYTFWPAEGVNVLDAYITGGSHETT